MYFEDVILFIKQVDGPVSRNVMENNQWKILCVDRDASVLLLR